MVRHGPKRRAIVQTTPLWNCATYTMLYIFEDTYNATDRTVASAKKIRVVELSNLFSMNLSLAISFFYENKLGQPSSNVLILIFWNKFTIDPPYFVFTGGQSALLTNTTGNQIEEIKNKK